MKKVFPIIFILTLAAILRFYNLADTFVFGGDEEYQSILAQSIVSNFHIIWVGVNAAHLGFYLGPFWTYFTALWLFLSKGNPLISGYISSLIGVFTVALIIYTGWKLFGRVVGLSAGLLYATLPLPVFFDQKYWNPTLIPLLSVAMLLSLSQAKFNSRWWLIFFFCFGLVFHIHLSLLPLGLIALFLLFIQKKDKNILLGILIFLIIYSPLIAFDYFHKGSNITTPLRFKEFSQAPTTRVNPPYHFDSFFQALGRIWYLKPFSSNADEVLFDCLPFKTIPNFWLSFLSLIFLLWFFIYAFYKGNLNYKLLISSIFLISISYLFFPGGAHEYYLLGIFPLMFFLPGILISLVKNKLIKKGLWIIIFALSFLGIFTILTVKSDFGISYKQKLISQLLNILGNSSFEIDQSGICHHFGGWRYLLKQAGKTPERSATDQSLGWLYPGEITTNPAKYKVIFQESRVPINFNIDNAEILSEGGFKAYIFKN